MPREGGEKSASRPSPFQWLRSDGALFCKERGAVKALSCKHYYTMWVDYPSGILVILRLRCYCPGQPKNLHMSLKSKVVATEIQGDSGKFESLMRRLVNVPHAEIREKLNAEREAKRAAKRASRVSAASSKGR
jgi:hypothetical protein